MYRTSVFWSYLILLGLGFIFPVAARAAAIPDHFQVVRDCEDEWLVYSQEYKNYVPYIRSLHESESSVSILIDLVENRHFHFLLKTRSPAVLFVDGALQHNLVANEWLSFSCDSLSQIYGGERIILTLFGLRGMDGLSSYMVFHKNETATDSLQVFSRSLVSLKPKSANVYRDFSIIAWILILAISAVVFAAVPDLAYKMANPVEFFSRDFRSELYNHHRAYSPLIVFAVAVLSLITAFLLLTVEIYVIPFLPGVLSVSGSESVATLTFEYLRLTLLCFVLFYVKYLMIYITLGILNMSELAHIHFIKAVQSSLLMYGSLSVVLFALIFQYPVLLEGLGDSLLLGVMIYFSVRLVVLYVVLNPTGRIINLYLISYLCVVELIPLIIGIKFVM